MKYIIIILFLFNIAHAQTIEYSVKTVNGTGANAAGNITVGGGSSIGDSLVRLYDTAAAHNARIGAVTVSNALKYPLSGGSYLSATDGTGFLGLTAQSTAPTAPTSGLIKLYANSTGRLSWLTSIGFARTINSRPLTADRTYTFYNKDYTVADSADVWNKNGNNITAADWIGSSNNSSLRFRTNNTLTAQFDSYNAYGSRFTVFGDANSNAYLDTRNAGNVGQLGLMKFGSTTTIDADGLLSLRDNAHWEIRTKLTSDNIVEVKNNQSGTLSPSFFNVDFTGSVGINNPTPATSAILDITSTTKGLLIPRMTNTQMNAISSPATGLMVYDLTDSVYSYYDGGRWSNVGSEIVNNNLATTPSTFADMRLVNNTAATVGAQKISPALGLYGNGWKTNATAGSQRVGFYMNVLPIQGTTNPTANLQFISDINGATSTTMTLSNLGGLTINHLMTIGATSYFGFGGSRARIYSPADGILTLNNNAATDFTRLQFGGTTTSFPAIGRTGTQLRILLADGSADASLRTGGLVTGYRATATSITATANDFTIAVTATGQTITLPTAVGVTGQKYTIKLTAVGTATVATTSSQTIDGVTTYSLSAQYKYVTVQSTGAGWIITGNN